MSKPLTVSAQTRPQALGGAIAHEVEQHGTVAIRAIGAGAVNQAVKGIAIARGYLAPQGIDLVCTPGFCDDRIDGEERTVMLFYAEPRYPRAASLRSKEAQRT